MRYDAGELCFLSSGELYLRFSRNYTAKEPYEIHLLFVKKNEMQSMCARITLLHLIISQAKRQPYY